MKASPLFSKINTGAAYRDEADCASYKGITLKTLFLVGITAIVSAIIAFYLPTIIKNGNLQGYLVALIVSAIVGFIAVIVGRLSDRAAKYASFIYAVCEGIALGFICLIADLYIPGVVAIAVFATLGLLFVMLLLFATGVIRAGSIFRRVFIAFILIALPTVIITYLALTFWVKDYQTYMMLVMAIEVIYLLYGTFCLVMNFGEAQSVVEAGASKNSEWSVALGLEVTIIYLFIQILRILLIVMDKKN